MQFDQKSSDQISKDSFLLSVDTAKKGQCYMFWTLKGARKCWCKVAEKADQKIE